MSKTVTASIPQEKIIRGYAIKRMPIGAYLKALQTVEKLPQRLIETLFPGLKAEDVLKILQNLDKQLLYSIFVQSLSVVPAEVIAFFSEISGINEEALLNDEAVGIDGIVEMMLAWWEVNGIENFIKSALQMAEKIKAVRASIGFKN